MKHLLACHGSWLLYCKALCYTWDTGAVLQYDVFSRMSVQVTYADVAEHALGAAGKTAVEVLLVVSQTGFCVAYVIFIHDTLPDVVPAVTGWMVMAIIVPVQVCWPSAG